MMTILLTGLVFTTFSSQTYLSIAIRYAVNAGWI